MVSGSRDKNGAGPTSGSSPFYGEVNIGQVADRAGVARSTVSRALNNSPEIAVATRTRVLEVARELGYVPSRSARSLRAEHTQTLGLIAPDLESLSVLPFVRAAVTRAFQRGYTVFVCDAQGSPSALEAHLNRMIEHRVDGILFGRGAVFISPAVAQLLRTMRIPIEPEMEVPIRAEGMAPIAINPYQERPDLERPAAQLAYRDIVSLGHSRIAYIQRPNAARKNEGDIRRISLSEVVAAAGLAEDSIIDVVIGRDDICISEIQKLSALAKPPTAIICANASLAPLVLRGIKTARWRIPSDVSFLAYGDSAWQEAFEPSISVVRHNYAAAAEQSLNRLIARAEGSVDIPVPPQLPAEYVPRASVGPAPAQ